MEQLASMVQILDIPVPQLVEQLADVMRFFDTLLPVPEQAISVPKILPDDVPARTAVRDTELVEELVEVPTIVSFSYYSLQRIVEQNVDIPIPGGGGRFAGLQGFPLEQSSIAPAAQIVDISVSGGGLQGFRPGQGSSSSHFPAGVHENLNEPSERFFALFPNLEKVRRPQPLPVRGCTPVSAHPRRLLSSRTRTSLTPPSGCSSVTPPRASPISVTDAPMRLSGGRRLASRWSGSARGGRGLSGTGTGAHTSSYTLPPLPPE